MQIYELSYLILPSIPEDALDNIVSKMNEVINKAGGVFFDSEQPFKQALAYTMSKNVGASHYLVDEAYLGWMKFELEPQKVEAINGQLEKTDELLRFLIVKAPRETTFTFAKARTAAKEEKEKESVATSSEEVVLE